MENLNADFEEEMSARQEEINTSLIKDLSFEDIYRCYKEVIEFSKIEDFRWFHKLRRYVRNKQDS